MLQFHSSLDHSEHCATTGYSAHAPIYNHQTWQSPDVPADTDHQPHPEFYALQTHLQNAVLLH